MFRSGYAKQQPKIELPEDLEGYFQERQPDRAPNDVLTHWAKTGNNDKIMALFETFDSVFVKRHYVLSERFEVPTSLLNLLVELGNAELLVRIIEKANAKAQAPITQHIKNDLLGFATMLGKNHCVAMLLEQEANPKASYEFSLIGEPGKHDISIPIEDAAKLQRNMEAVQLFNPREAEPIPDQDTAHHQLVTGVTALSQLVGEAAFLPMLSRLNNKKYAQALRCACTSNHPIIPRIIKLFMAHKDILDIDINEQPGDAKLSALHHAAKKGNHAVYDILLQAGADPTLKDGEEKIAADYLPEPSEDDEVETPTFTLYAVSSPVKTNMLSQANTSYSQSSFASGTPLKYNPRSGIYTAPYQSSHYEESKIMKGQRCIDKQYNNLKGNKTIQFFAIQEDAVAYAKTLARPAGKNLDYYYSPLVFKTSVGVDPNQLTLETERAVSRQTTYSSYYCNEEGAPFEYSCFYLDNDNIENMKLEESYVVRRNEVEDLEPEVSRRYNM